MEALCLYAESSSRASNHPSLKGYSQDRIIIYFLNFGIVEDYPFPSSFLLPNCNFTKRIPIEDIFYGNALQFRIEGFGFGLIDMASSCLK
jgi:hypothetical protein